MEGAGDQVEGLGLTSSHSTKWACRAWDEARHRKSLSLKNRSRYPNLREAAAAYDLTVTARRTAHRRTAGLTAVKARTASARMLCELTTCSPIIAMNAMKMHEGRQLCMPCNMGRR